MIDLFKKVIGYIIEGTCTVLSYIVKYTLVVGPWAQEELNKVVLINPLLLTYISDIFKNQNQCRWGSAMADALCSSSLQDLGDV